MRGHINTRNRTIFENRSFFRLKVRLGFGHIGLDHDAIVFGGMRIGRALGRVGLGREFGYVSVEERESVGAPACFARVETRVCVAGLLL